MKQSLTGSAFGGKLVNTYRCLRCKQESCHLESFSDIPLAFPSSASSGENRMPSRATRSAATKANAMAGGASSSNSGGRECGGTQDDSSSNAMALEDLMARYLAPELLEGDNQYHCDKCGLQDAERAIRITHSPRHLVLTLLRFAYNVKTQARSKIFTDVTYPRTLQLPVRAEVSSASNGNSTSQPTKSKHYSKVPTIKKSKSHLHKLITGGASETDNTYRMDLYGLSAVIVHSGLSLDGGHYYCYARHNIPVQGTENHDKQLAGTDFFQDKWYLFNDSRVSYSSYDSFSNVTKRFAKDTAYVLVYTKIDSVDSELERVDPNESICTSTVDPPLSRVLREAVEKDNKLFLQVIYFP